MNNQSNTKLFEDLIKDFTVLQTALNARDKEIQRLKKGYDSAIYRKYLKRFIRTYDALSDEMEAAKSEDNNQHYKTLKEIREVLMDAFDECGVSSFSPKIGASIKNAFGVDENFLTTPAKNKEEEYTIANVIESGFKIQTPTGEDCIKKAKVTLYTPQKEK